MTQAFDLGAIANQSRTAVRSRMNVGFQALTTQHSGPVSPSPSYANMLWFDTASGEVKLRDPANSSWSTIGTIGPPFAWSAQQAKTGLLETALSGTGQTLSSIPSGVVSFDFMLIGVSASGTWNVTAQLGTSGGMVTAGYAEACEESGGAFFSNSSSSFLLAVGMPTNALIVGHFRFTLSSSNRWTMNGLSSDVSINGSYNSFTSGTVVLPGTLDRIAVATNGGGPFTGGAFQLRYYQ